MHEPEVKEPLAAVSDDSDQPARAVSTARAANLLAPQTCATCGAAQLADDGGGPSQSGFVYAIGRIEARFPRPGVEKEFAQATGRAETAGLTDRQALQSVLSQRQNRYLARQFSWVMTIEGIETYILVPRDSADLDLLLEALRPTPQAVDLDCVVGVRRSISPPEMCNGLMLPMVAFDQIYSFTREALIEALVKTGPRPEKIAAEKFESAAQEIFDYVMHMADNAGATDEHRALNYLVMRYPGIYARVADAFSRDFSLTGVDVRPSPLSATSNIVDVIFSFTNRNTDFTEKSFVRVDVTDEFPYLVTKLSPYYTH